MTQTTESRIQAYLDSIEIKEPARSFSKTVSNIYHGFESEIFDQVHDEITETADHWSVVLRRISASLPASARVLDVGTGTGFAATQVLQSLGSQVGEMVCLDLSTDMLSKCRAKIQSRLRRSHFVAGDLKSLAGGAGTFDLVVTSAMLHHVIDVESLLGVIGTLVKPGGFYVAGHEPSYDFYANRALYRWTSVYRAWRRARGALSLTTWRRRVAANSRAHRGMTIEERTNEALVRMRLVRRPLPAGAITQLVDVHIPPASADVPFWGEPGFRPADLCQRMLGGFDPVFVLTYPHVKEARARMGWMWRRIDTMLAQRYPLAGANFLMAARKPVG